MVFENDDQIFSIKEHQASLIAAAAAAAAGFRK
jgi:hypothetical protein